MSDCEERAEDARINNASVTLRRRAQRINAELRATAGVSDEPPAYVCESCCREIDFCKCEDDIR